MTYRPSPLRILLSLVTTGFLTACAAPHAYPPEALPKLAWDSTCYDDIAYVASELAGEEATDCGLLRIGSSTAPGARFRQCIASASTSGEPFLLGRVSVLPDASSCTVAMRAKDGQLWELYYNFDYDHSAPSDGDEIAFRWILQMSRCESMDRVSVSSGYFELKGCRKDQAMTQRMFDARKRPNRDVNRKD